MEKKYSSEEIIQRDRILAAVCCALPRLLRSNQIQANIFDILASFGSATGCDYCFLCEIDPTFSNPPINIGLLWQKANTSNLDIAPLIESFILHFKQEQDGFFIDSCNSNQLPREVPGFSFCALPTNQGDLSLEYLGVIFIEYDNKWTHELKEALRIFANLLGAILERNRFEERFRENEKRNQIILDAFPDLVIRIDNLGKILDYISQKNHPLFINREMVTGKFLSEIWPKSVVNKIMHRRKKRRFTVPMLLDEFKLPFSNKVYESRLDPIGPEEALILIRDVTEQAELKQMNSDFINQASHELRTPVTTAILMAELIHEGGSPQETEEYWKILNSELNRQKILIDRLLIAGRLESGMMQFEILPTDIELVLQESISAINPIAKKKNISLELSVPKLLPKILGDKSGLQQVFINLINNAIKYSPEGSSVKIRVALKENLMEVDIIDQGMGIPAHETSHLFERFFRARDVSIAEIPGSGVGLFIVKSILEGLGGSIKLTNSSSLGTTFTATLKLAEG